MTSFLTAALGVVVSAVMLGVGVSGCCGNNYGDSNNHDDSKLLLTYIRLDPADEFYAGPVVPDPGGKRGVSTTFQDWQRTIVDTILILPSAEAATEALNQAASDLSAVVTAAGAESVPVGGGGTVVTGKSPDGSKSVSVLLFTEGKAFTTLEFYSRPADPVSTLFIVPVGQEQDARIKASLVS